MNEVRLDSLEISFRTWLPDITHDPANSPSSDSEPVSALILDFSVSKMVRNQF